MMTLVRRRVLQSLGALGVAAALTFSASPASADPPASLDARIAQLMQSSGAPGMSVAIVERGQVTLTRGYGIRRLGYTDRVDADTIFQIGSVTKNFTAAALAQLADRGELQWDDPVINHIAGFQMYDPWVTREISIRDLLVHRSGLGLGQGDLLFLPRTNLSRAETVRRLRYMRPATSFRSGYAYDNLLYIAAGQAIEEVSGQTWEDYVRTNLLRPAGMRTATSSLAAWRATRNRAWVHGRRNGPIVGMGDQQPLDSGVAASYGPELGENSAPAGGIAASANDMARWMLIQLAHGAIPGGSQRLFSEAQSAEMWTPQINMPIRQLPPPVAAATPQFNAYALGWTVRDYRGHRIITHGGGVLGSITTVVLIPELDVGFTVMMNSEDIQAIYAIQYELLDHYLGLPPQDWGAAWASMMEGRTAGGLAAVQGAATTRVSAGPSLPLQRYAGEYSDPWYGPISIAYTNERLVMDFKQTPGMIGDVTHWQYDSFRVDWRDPLIEPAFVTFTLGADGSVQRIGMRAISPVADFSWDFHDLDITRVAR